MANPEHLAILKQGVEVWNEWRDRHFEIRADLNASDLGRVILPGARLSNVDLGTSDLSEADFRKASFYLSTLVGSNLKNANLQEADLAGVDFREATLHNANLRQTNLLGTIISDVDIVGADLFGARLGWTVFGNVDLSMTTGLDSIVHQAPSVIGIDTIYRSGGNIPESFLRGCGVPETFITYARSLVGKPIDFYSCFISHSTKDKRFCERLYADLQAKGVRVWYFPEDAKWGEPVWGEIDRSIRIYDKLIVVCSKNALASVPVQREIERALNREDKEHKNILFSITIDDFIFDEWDHSRKPDVLAKVVGDFRGWSRSADKYDKAFKRLLKTLKAA